MDNGMFGINKKVVKEDSTGRWSISQVFGTWPIFGLYFTLDELKELKHLLPEMIEESETELKKLVEEKEVEIKKVGIEYNNTDGIRPYLTVITNDPVEGVTQNIDILASEVQDMLKYGAKKVIIKEPKRFHKEFVRPVYGDVNE